MIRVNTATLQNKIEELNQHQTFFQSSSKNFQSGSFNASGCSELKSFLNKISKNYTDISSNIKEVKEYLKDYKENIEGVERKSSEGSGSIPNNRVNSQVNKYRGIIKKYRFDDTPLFTIENFNSVTSSGKVKIENIEKPVEGKIESALKLKGKFVGPGEWFENLAYAGVDKFTKFLDSILKTEDYDSTALPIDDKNYQETFTMFNEQFEQQKEEVIDKISKIDKEIDKYADIEEQLQLANSSSISGATSATTTNKTMYEEKALELILANTNFKSINEYKTYMNGLKREKMGIESVLNQLKVQQNQGKYICLKEYGEYQNYSYNEIDLDTVEVTYSEDGLSAKGDYKEYCKKYGEVSELEYWKAVELKAGGIPIASKEFIKYNDIIRASTVNPDFEKIYNYLNEKYGSEQAKQYLKDMESGINDVVGYLEAQDIMGCLSDKNDILSAVYNETLVSVVGLGSGLESFGDGLGYSCSAFVSPFTGEALNRNMSVSEYRSSHLIQELQKGEKTGVFLSNNFEISQGIGNMIPSMALSAVNPIAGSMALGVSSGGNSYHSALVDGYSYEQAVVYGVASGSSEAITERFLGGIPGLSDTKDLIALKPGKWKALGQWAQTMLKEGNEEAVQELMDASVRKAIFNENISVNELAQNVYKSWLYGGITAGILQGPGAINQQLSYNNVSKAYNQGIFTDATVKDILKANNIDVENVDIKNALYDNSQLLNQYLKNYQFQSPEITNKQVEKLEVKEEGFTAQNDSEVDSKNPAVEKVQSSEKAHVEPKIDNTRIEEIANAITKINIAVEQGKTLGASTIELGSLSEMTPEIFDEIIDASSVQFQVGDKIYSYLEMKEHLGQINLKPQTDLSLSDRIHQINYYVEQGKTLGASTIELGSLSEMTPEIFDEIIDASSVQFQVGDKIYSYLEMKEHLGQRNLKPQTDLSLSDRIHQINYYVEQGKTLGASTIELGSLSEMTPEIFDEIIDASSVQFQVGDKIYSYLEMKEHLGQINLQPQTDLSLSDRIHQINYYVEQGKTLGASTIELGSLSEMTPEIFDEIIDASSVQFQVGDKIYSYLEMKEHLGQINLQPQTDLSLSDRIHQINYYVEQGKTLGASTIELGSLSEMTPEIFDEIIDASSVQFQVGDKIYSYLEMKEHLGQINLKPQTDLSLSDRIHQINYYVEQGKTLGASTIELGSLSEMTPEIFDEIIDASSVQFQVGDKIYSYLEMKEHLGQRNLKPQTDLSLSDRIHQINYYVEQGKTLGASTIELGSLSEMTPEIFDEIIDASSVQFQVGDKIYSYLEMKEHLGQINLQPQTDLSLSDRIHQINYYVEQGKTLGASTIELGSLSEMTPEIFDEIIDASSVQFQVGDKIYSYLEMKEHLGQINLKPQTDLSLSDRIHQINYYVEQGKTLGASTIELGSLSEMTPEIFDEIIDASSVQFQVGDKIYSYLEMKEHLGQRNLKPQTDLSLSDRIHQINYYVEQGKTLGASTIELGSLSEMTPEIFDEIIDASSVQFQVGDKIYSYLEMKEHLGQRNLKPQTDLSLSDRIHQINYYVEQGKTLGASTIELGSLSEMTPEIFDEIIDASSVQFQVGDKIYSYLEMKEHLGQRNLKPQTDLSLSDRIHQINYYVEQGKTLGASTIELGSLSEMTPEIFDEIIDASSVQFQVGDKIYSYLEMKEHLGQRNLKPQTDLSLSDRIHQINYYVEQGKTLGASTIELGSLSEMTPEIFDEIIDASSVQFQVGDKIYSYLEMKEHLGQRNLTISENIENSIESKIDKANYYSNKGNSYVIDAEISELNLNLLSKVQKSENFFVRTPDGNVYNFSEVYEMIVNYKIKARKDIEALKNTGLTAEEAALEVCQEMEGKLFERGFDFYVDPETQIAVNVIADMDWSKQSTTPDYVLNIIKSLPKAFQSLVKEINFYDTENPNDLYWEEKYQTPNFISAATGSDGQINFWKSPVQLDKQTIIHEISHTIDQYIIEKLNWGDSFSRISETPQWSAAIQADKVNNHFDGITDYATTSVVEDFAESLAYYLINPSNLDSLPARKQLIEYYLEIANLDIAQGIEITQEIKITSEDLAKNDTIETIEDLSNYKTKEKHFDSLDLDDKLTIELIRNTDDNIILPEEFTNAEDYKRSFIQYLINSGKIDNYDSNYIFEIQKDTIMFSELIGTEKLFELYTQNLAGDYKTQKALIATLSALDPSEFDRFFDTPTMKNYLDTLSPEKLGEILKLFEPNSDSNISWLTNDTIMNKIINMEVEEFYRFINGINYYHPKIKKFIEAGHDSTNYLKLLDAIESKFYTIETVSENYEYKNKIDNLLVKNINNEIVVNKINNINKTSTAIKSKINEAIKKSTNLEITETISSLQIKVDPNYQYFDLTFDINGNKKTITLEKQFNNSLSFYWITASPEYASALLAGNLTIESITPNINKSNLYLTKDNGLEKGLNEVVLSLDGIEKKIIVNSKYDTLNLNGYRTNEMISGVKEVLVTSVNPVGSYNIEVESPTTLYVVSYELDGKNHEVIMKAENANNKNLLNIDKYIEGNNLVGISNIKVTEATQEQILERANQIKNYNSNKDIFTDEKYGGDQSDVPKILKAFLSEKALSSIDLQKAKIMNELINKYFPNATDAQKIMLATHYEEGGCNYMAVTNAFATYMGSIENGSEIFSQKFGFDLKSIDGQKISYNLEAIAFDIYLTYFSNKFNGDIEQIINSGSSGAKISQFNEKILSYFEKHGINVESETVSLHGEKHISPELIKVISNNTNIFNILIAKHFDLKSVEANSDIKTNDAALMNSNKKNAIISDIGGHAMLITGLDANMNLIVSSWSRKLQFLAQSIQEYQKNGIDSSYANIQTIKFSIPEIDGQITSKKNISETDTENINSSFSNFIKKFTSKSKESNAIIEIARNLELVIKTMDLKYNNQGRSRILDYLANGDSNIITRENNCRAYIESLDIDQVRQAYEYLNNNQENYNSSQNRSVDIKEIARNLELVIKTMDLKYNNQGKNQVLEYLNTGNISLITSDNNCRAYIKSLPIELVSQAYEYLNNQTNYQYTIKYSIEQLNQETPNPCDDFENLSKIEWAINLGNEDPYLDIVSANTKDQKIPPTDEEIKRYYQKIANSNYLNITHGVFSHILTDYSLSSTATKRLYINIHDFNETIKFAKAFMDKCSERNIPFYFKTADMSNGANQIYPSHFIRDESMVIYSNDAYVTEYVNICNEIRSETNIEFSAPPVLTGVIDGYIGYACESQKRKGSYNRIRTDIVKVAVEKTNNQLAQKYGIHNKNDLLNYVRSNPNLYNYYLKEIYNNIYFVSVDQSIDPNKFFLE